jgi:hypothetical protein
MQQLVRQWSDVPSKKVGRSKNYGLQSIAEELLHPNYSGNATEVLRVDWS